MPACKKVNVLQRTHNRKHAEQACQSFEIEIPRIKLIRRHKNMVMTAAESAITITVFFFTNCSIADRMHTLFILFALLLFLSFIFSPFAFFC